MIPRDEITGLILSGGRGARMGGVDKGLQNHLGTPLALHALLRLSPQVGEIMINANRNLGAYESMGVPVWPDSLPDYAGAIINNDFATKAGLSTDDVIAQDDPNDPSSVPYANVFAARAEDKDNEVLLELVDIFQSTKAVTDGVLEVSGGTAVLVTTPVSELEESLATVEKDYAASE